MGTLTTEKGSMPQKRLGPSCESVFINRILDTLLTIPSEHWKAVMRTVTRWVEAGLTSNTVKKRC